MERNQAKCANEEKFKLPVPNINYDEVEKPPAREIVLDGVAARVDKIHIDGLVRTKDDIIKDCIGELFEATDFQGVLIRAHRVRLKLDELGCFKNIGVFIDTSKGPGASKDGLEVTFNVKEHKRVVGGVSTQFGNNEGCLMVSMRTPNLCGRGERMQVEYTHGSRGTTNFNVGFVKPFRGKHRPIFSASIFQHQSEWPSSGCKEIGQGILLDLGFNTLPIFKHNLQWEGVIRDVVPLGKDVAFSAREQAGTNLKSALRHILSIDLRDDAIFPSCGSLLQVTKEFAGVGGNIGFLKGDFYAQRNFSILEDYVIQATLTAGVLKGIGNDMKITISDMFFLGGATSVRGYQSRGIGPQNEGAAEGAVSYWAAGLHLFTPLPFRPGKGGFGELFRSHVFFNAGNIGDFLNTESGTIIDNLVNNIRLSYGLGLALRLGNMARVEVNYCFPVTPEKSDKVQPGVQFGIGVQFL